MAIFASANVIKIGTEVFMVTFVTYFKCLQIPVSTAIEMPLYNGSQITNNVREGREKKKVKT